MTMRIENINLIGFKSFLEKTIFNFHPGLTAIVGPNGCGKSNVVDAFKWVLGEQSAKSLRGDNMEDVIFAGSSTKKPRGMSEVTLMLSGILGGESSEPGQASITRRLYRSGESEYLINKVPCRLKDIKNMFLDTGLELKAYSILEQGRIDAILNSKPKERRFLIEEVAGVMKYNLRRGEALQKLENAKLNLQRLQDIITEVKRQINSIDRHAKKAERYKRLFDEIKGIEIKVSARDIGAMSDELGSIVQTVQKLKHEETELSTGIHSSDALIEEKKVLCVEREKGLEAVQARLNAAEREFIEEEGKISLYQSDSENLRERLQRIRVRENELLESKENFSGQIDDVRQRKSGLDTEYSEIQNILKSMNEEHVNLESTIDGIEKNLESMRQQILHKTGEISTTKNEMSTINLIKDNQGKKIKQYQQDIASIEEKVSSLTQSIEFSRKDHARLDEELKNKLDEKQNISLELASKKEERTSIEEKLYRDREELAAMRSRQESLMELDRRGESSVKDTIKVLCQVADIFEAEPEHETAIEAVLGDKLRASVVDDYPDIKKALFLIREKGTGRSGFIPVNIPRSRNRRAVQQELPDDVIGKAADIVKVREGFDSIANSLLHDVMIVNNLDTAFRLWHTNVTGSTQTSGMNHFVTIDGEVLEPSGIVYGGFERGVLKVKREIRELNKNIEMRRGSITSAEEKVLLLRNALGSLENNVSSTDNDIKRIEKEHHEKQVRLKSLEDDLHRQQERLEHMSAELSDERKEVERADTSLRELQDACNSLEKERERLEEDLKNIQTDTANNKKLLGTIRSDLTETMLLNTSITEKIVTLDREEARMQSELKDIERKREQISEEYREIESSIKIKEEEIHHKKETLRESVLSIEKLKGETFRSREILNAQTAELNMIESQQKGYTERLSSIRKDLAGVEVKKTELSMGISHTKENIQNIYSIDLESIPEEQVRQEEILPEEEEKLPVLREKLRDMGPVNLGTLEELEELRTRYDFLTGQQGDLLQSIESLQETISKINRTTRKKLTEAFEALNEKFKEVFTILFGKGRAELVLTDDDVLEAGIEIVAQPPGKKLQNLMLLSGGEKALTALSLLFAGFMIKPTPLCLLDEVDAPLDESNTDRFSTLLRELAKSIQFIIITHNRRTMEVADYLYGVTMEEPGISKVVSMHLTEAV
jgi:chromosome segregation protein